LTALGVVLCTGLVHGLWTQRWADNRDLEEAAARLERVPVDVGDWHGEDLGIDAVKLARAEAAGYLFRRYTNRGTGQSVNVMVLCGRFGPLSVHTPDVCFGGAGYATLGSATRVSVAADGGAPVADLWAARFEKKTGPVAQGLRALWSWSTGRGWQAPDYPRLVFRAAPVLYKLYVVRELARPDEPLDDEPGTALLRDLLPQLDAALGGP
jgi:hypothetical protein